MTTPEPRIVGLFDRRVSFMAQPCGADGRPLNGGMSYANPPTYAAARDFAARVLADGTVDSVEAVGQMWEFYGPAWRVVTGDGAHYERHVFRLVNAGWDGASQPIVELREDCGCSWTRDGSARLATCTACLSAAAHA